VGAIKYYGLSYVLTVKELCLQGITAAVRHAFKQRWWGGGKLFEKSFPPRPPSETFGLLQPCRPVPARQRKSLWKGVWGKSFLQKGFPPAQATRPKLEPRFLIARGGGGSNNCGFGLQITRARNLREEGEGQVDSLPLMMETAASNTSSTVICVMHRLSAHLRFVHGRHGTSAVSFR